jgi:3-oxoacyl-[acyl-carrier protein] reductase
MSEGFLLSNTTQRRTALITGGAGGIGAAIARQLADDGHRVVIADLDAGRAQAVAGALAGEGHSALSLDVGSEESVRRGLAEAEHAVGPLHVLVHAAGQVPSQADGGHARFWEFGVDRWDRVMAVNARGTYLVAAEFMRRRVDTPVENGRIVVFSSITGQTGGSRTVTDYAASKAAVLGFLRSAARECAPLGITVNAVAPGQIETPMLRESLGAHAEVDPRIVPVGRFGQPHEVAQLVRYIVSPETSFVTGATFDINGGQRMQ